MSFLVQPVASVAQFVLSGPWITVETQSGVVIDQPQHPECLVVTARNSGRTGATVEQWGFVIKGTLHGPTGAAQLFRTASNLMEPLVGGCSTTTRRGRHSRRTSLGPQTVTGISCLTSAYQAPGNSSTAGTCFASGNQDTSALTRATRSGGSDSRRGIRKHRTLDTASVGLESSGCPSQLPV